MLIPEFTLVGVEADQGDVRIFESAWKPGALHGRVKSLEPGSILDHVRTAGEMEVGAFGVVLENQERGCAAGDRLYLAAAPVGDKPQAAVKCRVIANHADGPRR